jgi:hypothetical protein
MLLSRHQNAGQNGNINTANRSFENVAQFKYFGTTVTDQNLIHEEIKKRLMLATIQSRTFCLLSKNVKSTIYKIIILPV